MVNRAHKRTVAAVLIVSLQVHRSWINLLIEFGSKTKKRNTTKNKFIRYFCFIADVFIHSCHRHCLKVSGFSFEEKYISVSRFDLQAINATTAFTILKALNTSSWKYFWFKGYSSNFENSPSFHLSWTWPEWCLSKLHSTAVCHFYLPRWPRWWAY